MNITEEDIFYFVFDKSILTEEKKNYLEANSELFSEEIELCEDLWNSKINEDNLKTFISDKINEYSLKIIDLYPIEVHQIANNDKVLLAAACAEITKNIQAESFSDRNSEYLARIIKVNESLKVYIYKRNNAPDTPVKITIYPSNRKYILENLSEGLLLNEMGPVERIRIEQ